jgi:hypothetical protein
MSKVFPLLQATNPAMPITAERFATAPQVKKTPRGHSAMRN